MNGKLKNTFILTGFLLNTFLSIAQSEPSNNKPARFKTTGAMMGYGKAINKETDYKVFYLAGDFSWSFTKQPKKKFFVTYYVEPQVNPVRTQRPWDIEVGTNAGIRTYWKINEDFYCYQMLGSGPHFITAEVKRQANGFIFSDNAALGFFKKINNKNRFLNFQLRWRHLSNAGLKRPNSGIDSWNILLGLSGL
ncbi:MAG: acyloxyacyl hydrolase [Flavisolibacter sp.]